MLPVEEPDAVAPFAVPECSGAAACSSRESLPSRFLSNVEKPFSCGVPLASAFVIEPSLSLSSDVNIASAPPSDLVAPELAEPAPPAPAELDAPVLAGPEPPVLEDCALGDALLPLDALSPPAYAKDPAKAAATVMAINVFSFMASVLSMVTESEIRKLSTKFSTSRPSVAIFDPPRASALPDATRETNQENGDGGEWPRCKQQSDSLEPLSRGVEHIAGLFDHGHR